MLEFAWAQTCFYLVLSLYVVKAFFPDDLIFPDYQKAVPIAYPGYHVELLQPKGFKFMLGGIFTLNILSYVSYFVSITPKRERYTVSTFKC